MMAMPLPLSRPDDVEEALALPAVSEVVGSSKMMILRIGAERLGDLDELPLALAEARHRRSRRQLQVDRPPAAPSLAARIRRRSMKRQARAPLGEAGR